MEMHQFYNGARRRAAAALAVLVTAGALTLVAATPAQARAVCRYAGSVVSSPGSTSIATRLVPVPSTSTTADPTCDMGYGAVSAAVEGLQQDINECYLGGTLGSANIISTMRTVYNHPNWSGLSEDGQFGALTRDAVKSVQRIEGVTADGVFGPNTRNAMRWFFSREETGCTRLDVQSGQVDVIAVDPNPNPHFIMYWWPI